MANGNKRSILFVAFPFSIHTVRWINQLVEEDWDIHLFSSHPFAEVHKGLSSKVHYHPNPLHFTSNRSMGKRIMHKVKQVTKKISTKRSVQPGDLARLIRKIKPEIIHTLESQNAGYLVSNTRDDMNWNFPTWVHSNWGIDLHFFRQLKEHQPRLTKLLSQVDVFITEGERDAQLARSMGFNGAMYTFPSVGGGFKVPGVPYVAPSKRKKILVKGTQDILRRGLIALNAVERCIHLLKEYDILVYSACQETKVAAELITFRTGKEIRIIENCSQDEMLQLNAQARINLCTNLSDGLPNCMIEAMLTGCFPIQSETSLANEWIEHGKTGLIVPPEDAAIVAAGLQEALTNDKMVDEAAAPNMEKIRSQLDYEKMREKAVALYSNLLN